MKDLIVYCPNTLALITELQKKHPKRLNEEDSAQPRFLIDKTPTKRNEDETLALVRVMDEETKKMLDALESAKVIKILGTWKEVKENIEAKKIYDRVYPRTSITFVNEDKTEHISTPPEEIGRFA